MHLDQIITYFTGKKEFNPRQKEAFAYLGKGKYIFYGGARGGGKTHLSRASAVLTAIQKPGMKIALVRKTFDELKKQFKTYIEMDYPADVFGYRYYAQDKKFVFPNESEILLSPCMYAKDVDRIQGVEYGLIIIDEANQHEKEVIEAIRGSLRVSRNRIENWIETLLMTGNPGGKADYHFKTRFVEPDYSKWGENELVNKDKYVFIPAKVDDNPHVGDEYAQNLAGMDEHKRKQWLEGSWEVNEGQFFTMWDERAHVVDDFEIPPHWRTFAAGLDMGFSKKHPTVVLWGAQDPATEDVYIVQEYLNGTGTVEDHAIMINEYTNNLIGGIPGRMPIVYADPSIFKDKNVKKTAGELQTANIFLDHSVFVTPAVNTRIDGWRHVKQWLSFMPDKTLPKLKFFRHGARVTIDNMPLFRYNNRTLIPTEDLDTDQSYDDIADALRYLMMSAFYYPSDTNKFYDSSIDEISLPKEQAEKIPSWDKGGYHLETKFNPVYEAQRYGLIQASRKIRDRR